MESLSRSQYEGLPPKEKDRLSSRYTFGCEEHYIPPKMGCVKCLKSQMDMEAIVQHDMDGRDKSLPVLDSGLWSFPKPSKN